MPIRDATKDEIEALRARLREKREQRRLEADRHEQNEHPPRRGNIGYVSKGTTIRHRP